MDLVEHVHMFGLSDIHTFELDISLIIVINIIFNHATHRLMTRTHYLFMNSQLLVFETLQEIVKIHVSRHA